MLYKEKKIITCLGNKGKEITVQDNLLYILFNKKVCVLKIQVHMVFIYGIYNTKLKNIDSF